MLNRSSFLFGRILGMTVFTVILFCETNFASAQANSYLGGTTPAINPWLSLSNKRTGVLDSYNQYVRPQLELQKAISTQQAQLNRQGAQQQMMYQQSQQQQAAMQSGGAVTGRAKQAASFRNYSHYYPKMR